MTDRVSPGRGDRIFHTFRRWPLVPTEDLVKLRQSLRQVHRLGGPAGAGELLKLVDHEIQRRAQTEQWEHAAGTGPVPD